MSAANVDAFSRRLYISPVISNVYVQICLYANGNVINVIKLSVTPLDCNSTFSRTQGSALSNVNNAQKLSTVPMILEDMNEHTQVKDPTRVHTATNPSQQRYRWKRIHTFTLGRDPINVPIALKPSPRRVNLVVTSLHTRIKDRLHVIFVSRHSTDQVTCDVITITFITLSTDYWAATSATNCLLPRNAWTIIEFHTTAIWSIISRQIVSNHLMMLSF